MKLRLNNIGKIKSANVDISGITVIAGENDTGKSTVGKALFSVFNCLFQSEKRIAAERINSVENVIQMLFRNATDGFYFEADYNDLSRNIVKNVSGLQSFSEVKQSVYRTIFQMDERITSRLSEEDVDKMSDRIATNLTVGDEVIFRSVLQRYLDSEFNEQISNAYVPDEFSSITLEIRGEEINILIDNNRVLGTDKRLSLGTEAIYIDDPFVLDEVPSRFWRMGRRYTDHRMHLKDKLYFSPREGNVVEEIVANSKLEEIYKKISSVCEGDVVRSKGSTLSYTLSGFEKPLDVRNLSTGLKTFVILKMLLLSGKIEPNGTIILDEPEIHLHPEWQLLFAELIVLLHKEFGLHVLLNTHSPYFLNALEVYAAKYGVDDNCKYYLATSNSGISYVEDVTNNIELIYSKLARPLQRLENERYSDD